MLKSPFGTRRETKISPHGPLCSVGSLIHVLESVEFGHHMYTMRVPKKIWSLNFKSDKNQDAS